ncbi:hypothetical protein ACOSQ3_017596 [Xanthoceras sorbifolium]
MISVESISMRLLPLSKGHSAYAPVEMVSSRDEDSSPSTSGREHERVDLSSDSLGESRGRDVEVTINDARVKTKVEGILWTMYKGP